MSPESQHLLLRILQAASIPSDEPFPPSLVEVLNEVAKHDERLGIRLEVAGRLPELNCVTGAGGLALWLGAGVEHGLDPQSSVRPLLKTMQRWWRSLNIPAIDPEAEEDAFPEHTVDPQVELGLQWLGQGLVAHLARLPELRTQIAQQPNLMEELEFHAPWAVGVYWVYELVRKCSGTLLVIHATEQKGVRVSYENLSNCFHLFTLLQGALSGSMPGARQPSKQALAVAQGRSDEECHDAAWWHYGIGASPQPDMMTSVFGEPSPAEIPQIEGTQVLLLWPPIMQSRSWSSGFFGPRLDAAPPSVKVLEHLSSAEVEQWYRRLGLPM
jgi:hypothetical protein